MNDQLNDNSVYRAAPSFAQVGDSCRNGNTCWAQWTNLIDYPQIKIFFK